MNLVDEFVAIPTPCLVFLCRTALVPWASCSTSWEKSFVTCIPGMELLLLGEYEGASCSFHPRCLRSRVLLFSKSKRSVPLRKQACVFLTAVPLWVREIVLKATDNGGYLRVIWAAQIFISCACSPCKGNSTFWWTVSILLRKHPECIKYCRLKNALFIIFSIKIS